MNEERTGLSLLQAELKNNHGHFSNRYAVTVDKVLVATSTKQLRTIGSVAYLLSATLYQR